jgi:hypothetical protein
MSPELNKKDAKYIEGCSAGDLFNNVTHQVWDGEKGIEVVPCYKTVKYLEFVIRDNGGGFVGEISPNDPIIQRTEKQGTMDILPNGNQLVKSDQWYCLVLDDQGDFQPAVIDMKVTQLKVSKRWATMINMNKATNPKTGQRSTLAIYSTVWKLYSVDETNKRNETYANYAVQKVGMIEDPQLFLEAKQFHASCVAGEVKAMNEEEQSSSTGSSTDNEIPF